MKKNKIDIFKYYCIILSIFVIAVSAYRAFTTGLTYDESFSYINYVNENPFLVLSYFFNGNALANNHLLNTFFISLFQFVTSIKYSEVLIRMPNLLFYFLYLYASYKISKTYKNKFLVFVLFALIYGLNEYFSIARGYGMATALVTMAIYYFKQYLDSNNDVNINICFLLFVVSAFANTITLLIYASFIIVFGIKLLIEKQLLKYFKKNWVLLIPLVIITLLLVRYHFLISSDGLPLYYSKVGFFKGVIINMFESYGFANYSLVAFFIVAFLLVISLIKNKKIVIKQYSFYIVPIYFIIFVVSISIKGVGWPTGRCLLPTIPLIIWWLSETVNVLKMKRKYICAINVMFICVLGMFFINKISLKYVEFFRSDYQIRDNVKMYYKTGDLRYVESNEYHPSIDFYKRKNEYEVKNK